MGLLLLLNLLPLITAECPDFLRGVKTKTATIQQFEEAIDVACGRRHYSSIFWSREFYDQLTLAMLNKTDTETQAALKPLFENLQRKFEAMDSEEATGFDLDAKDFLDSTFERSKVLVENPDVDKNFYSIMALVHQKTGIISMMQPFSHGMSIALMQTMKSGFGVPETSVEQKQALIDAAMMTIARAQTVKSDDTKLGDLFTRLYNLAAQPLTTNRTAFDQFAEWTEKRWNSTIAPLVVLPGVELLYVQYQNLKISESRIFVDWYLSSLEESANINSSNNTEATMEKKGLYSDIFILAFPAVDVESQERAMERLAASRRYRSAEFAAVCPSKNAKQCFNALPDEARKEIESTFPELFRSIFKIYGFELWVRAKNTIVNNEIAEGSGEGSGQF